jgi:hypothetical protein
MRSFRPSGLRRRPTPNLDLTSAMSNVTSGFQSANIPAGLKLHRSGLGGQLMRVIPQIETVIVNMMNTDEPGPRISADQWDRLLGMVMAARLP